MMNAKELRAGAEEILERLDIDQIPPLSYAARLARHILATVRDDDDEPVTVEGLVALGGVASRSIGETAINFKNTSVCVLFYYQKSGEVSRTVWSSDYMEGGIPDWASPKTMREARELLKRCGAIETKGGEQ